MKNILKAFLFSAVIAPMVISCDDDTNLPTYTPSKMIETFSVGDGVLLDLPGWTNFSEAGTKKWRIETHNNNGYAIFNPYGSNEASNVGWLVTPEVDLNDGKNHTFTFRSAQSYVTSTANKLEVFISTNYNGSDVIAAKWTQLSANIPGSTATRFEFMDSGVINLAAYKGSKVHIAFKVTGSGTNGDLDGAYQVDNVIVH